MIFELEVIRAPYGISISYPSSKIIVRTTDIGSCPRKRQHFVRGVFDDLGRPIKPMSPHFYAIRGWTSHNHIEKFIQKEGDYDPIPLIPEELIVRHDITKDMFPTLEEHAKHDFDNFLKWFDKTSIDLSPSNLIGTEYYMEMPVAPPFEIASLHPANYVLRADVDLFLKSHIIDFKSGKKSYMNKYKWQLGNYRRVGRYHQLHKQCPDGDWKLMNVFLGGDEPEEYHPNAKDPKKVSKAMMQFDSKLSEFLINDHLIRTDPKYQAPCEFSVFCGFCAWRHCCRGV